tara:strand:- start:533 stop:838 length:306 start_codon:yes stop_codon:yes gene_type:complete
MNELTLSDIENDTLDYLIGMPMEDKHAYFRKLIETFYPKSLKNEDEYEALLENYVSCIYVEKLYRTNRFFQEQFTIVYTQTGLIRDVVNDLYFNDDSLITH